MAPLFDVDILAEILLFYLLSISRICLVPIRSLLSTSWILSLCTNTESRCFRLASTLLKSSKASDQKFPFSAVARPLATTAASWLEIIGHDIDRLLSGQSSVERADVSSLLSSLPLEEEARTKLSSHGLASEEVNEQTANALPGQHERVSSGHTAAVHQTRSSFTNWLASPLGDPPHTGPETSPSSRRTSFNFETVTWVASCIVPTLPMHEAVVPNKVIGRSSTSAVFAKGIWAVKVVDVTIPGREREFRAEYRQMRRLSKICASVVRPRAFERDNDIASYRMELCQGSARDLLHLVQQKAGTARGLPERWVLQILEEVTWALAQSHSLKLCHVDVKPGNILIRSFPLNVNEVLRQDSILLSDFGLVRTFEEAASMTHPLGSRAFMAPEMRCAGSLSSRHPPGPNSDLFSLGRTLEALLIGTDEERTDTERKQARSSFHFNTVRILGMLLEEDPTKRPNADQLLSHRLLTRHPLLRRKGMH